MLRLLALVTLWAALWAALVASVDAQEPIRCCTEEAFEVDLKLTSASNKGKPSDDKRMLHLVFDGKKQRWMLNQTVPRDSDQDFRMIFDYENKNKVMIDKNGCQLAPIKGSLPNFCIPENATFLGSHHFGYEDMNTLPFNMWAWDAPQGRNDVRIMSKISDVFCFPIDETFFTTYSALVPWYSGEKPCIPWEKPDVVRSGNCFKCFEKTENKKLVTHTRDYEAHVQYTNFFRGLHRHPFFEVPDACENVKEWKSVSLDVTQEFIIRRMQS